MKVLLDKGSQRSYITKNVDVVDVDVLIGADYYFLFAKKKCQKRATANSPTVVESTFGWIASMDCY